MCAVWHRRIDDAVSARQQAVRIGTYGYTTLLDAVRMFGLGVALVLGVDGAAEDCEAFWNGVVVDPSASFLAGDESCVAERFEVVADGRLGDAEGFDEIACGAGFSRCADQTE
jgi:hypothetical protein